MSWVQVWVGTPDLQQLHLQWYDLVTSATCQGLACTLPLAASFAPGEYVVYIQPWGPDGFIVNDLEGWLGPLQTELLFTLGIDPIPTATISPHNLIPQPDQTLFSTESTGTETIYRHITAGDVEELRTAVDEANNDPTKHYMILLPAGTYTFTSPDSFGTSALTVDGTITMVGLDAYELSQQNTDTTAISTVDQSILTHNTTNLQLVEVRTSGQLTLYNITFKEGGPNYFSGGAIAHNGRNLTIYNSIFDDNAANNFGGAIDVGNPGQNTTELYIVNTLFTQNRTDDTYSYGGAISINNNNTTNNDILINVRCSTFDRNSVQTTGGAFSVHNNATNLTLSVNQSNFISNYAGLSIGGAIDNAASSSGEAFNATDNYWNPAPATSGPYNSVSGADTSSQRTSPVPLDGTVSGCEVPPLPSYSASVTIPDNAQELLLTYTVPPPPQHLAVAQQAVNSSEGNLDAIATSPDLYGICDSSNKSNCARYTYLVFYAFFTEYTGNPPTFWDLFSVVYQGELGTYAGSQRSFEAFTRNFFDRQYGGCRYDESGSIYTCTYQWMIEWLATSQFWIDETNVTNINELTGLSDDMWIRIRDRRPITTQDLHANANVGMFLNDSSLANAILENLSIWRTGQGPKVPSRWGNEVLVPGATTYSNFIPEEQFDLVITHVFILSVDPLSKEYGFGDNNVWGDDSNEQISGPNITPNCSYASVITTSEGGIQNLGNC